MMPETKHFTRSNLDRESLCYWCFKCILLVGLVYCPLALTYEATSVSIEGHYITSVEANTACEEAVSDECKPTNEQGYPAYVWIKIDDVGTPSYRAQPCSAWGSGGREPDYCEEHYYVYPPAECLNGGCSPLENAGGDGNLTCKPVNIATGNKYYPQTDYIGRGSNPLTLKHYYNSKISNAHWSFSYRQSLTISTDSVEATGDDGKVIYFAIEGGEYIGSSLRADKLRLVGSEYQLLLSNGVIERYDLNGRLTSIDFPSGPDHQLTYNGTSVVVSNGIESLTLTLVDTSIDALISQVLLPNNEAINYGYDNVGGVSRLLSVSHSNTGGTSMTYFYEDTTFPSYVTGIEDENGNRISSVTYDSEGRAISSEMGPLNSAVERTQFQYNSDGSRTLTNALGKQTTYHFAYVNGEYKMTQTEGHPTANCAAANKNYTYYPSGLLETKTDWKNNTTSYQYNTRNLESSRTEALGTPQERTITTEWHPTFNLRTKITEPGRETIFIYDAEGRLQSQVSNALPLQ